MQDAECRIRTSGDDAKGPDGARAGVNEDRSVDARYNKGDGLDRGRSLGASCVLLDGLERPGVVVGGLYGPVKAGSCRVV